MAVRPEATLARRRAILDAALAAFLERGYDTTTIEDIRERSDASIGSLYHHFGGKEEIAGAIYLEALGDYQEGLLRTLERNPGARQAIEAIVLYHVRWIVRHADWSGFLFTMRGVEGVRPVERVIAEMNQRVFQRFAEWAEPHLHAGRLARHAHDVWYALCLGPAQEFGRLWLAGRATTKPDRAAAALAGAAWRALRGPKGR